MILVWILSGAVVLSMMSKNCRYEYDMAVLEHYVLKCRTESGIAISPSSVIQMVESLQIYKKYYRYALLQIANIIEINERYFPDRDCNAICYSYFHIGSLYRSSC